jgi:epoxyqueuosine reductase
MFTSDEIKKIAMDLGADRCGIANVERFIDAPDGFKPTDIYKECKSVVAFIKKMPSDIIFSDNPIPYTHVADLLYKEIDRIGLLLAYAIEDKNIHVVPVPCDTPYLFWDSERNHGQGILSMRHTGYLAGLGILGRNTLLINEELGNLIYIGAILTNQRLEPDPIITDFTCPPNCKKCLRICPQNALDGITVNQYLCRQISIIETGRGFEVYNCNKCRKICPYINGKRGKSSDCEE